MIKSKKGFIHLLINLIIVFALLSLSAFLVGDSFGWMTLTSKMGALTEVEEPARLSILDENEQYLPSINISNFTIERDKGTAYFVFCVYGESGALPESYSVELAHTTNTPFVYKLYRAIKSEVSRDDYTVRYGDFWYSEEDCLENGVVIDTNVVYNHTYSPNDENKVHDNAIPKCTLITIDNPQNSHIDDTAFAEFFVLEASYQITAENVFSKEIDIVYVLVEKNR